VLAIWEGMSNTTADDLVEFYVDTLAMRADDGPKVGEVVMAGARSGRVTGVEWRTIAVGAGTAQVQCIRRLVVRWDGGSVSEIDPWNVREVAL